MIACIFCGRSATRHAGIRGECYMSSKHLLVGYYSLRKG
jgi:hypothetical protein